MLKIAIIQKRTMKKHNKKHYKKNKNKTITFDKNNIEKCKFYLTKKPNRYKTYWHWGYLSIKNHHDSIAHLNILHFHLVLYY